MSLNTTIDVERGSFLWEIRNYDACATGVKIPSPIFETKTIQWSLALTKESHGLNRPVKKSVAFELEGNSEVLGKSIETLKTYFVKISVHAISAKNGTATFLIENESETYGSKAQLSGVAVIDENLLPEYLVNGVLTLSIDVAFSEVGQFTTSSRLVDCESVSLSSKRESSLETMLSDIKSVLSKDVGDIVLFTKKREFRVHKFILSARSPAFLEMIENSITRSNKRVFDNGILFNNGIPVFDNHMRENRTKRVKITDMSTPVLSQMIDYMNGGEVDGASSDTCGGLYAAADKYCMPDLKLRCARILENLSVDIVCDVATMAHLHQDTELLAKAKSYISSRAAQVICSKGWMELVKKVPALATDLAVTMLPRSDDQDMKGN